MTELPLWAIGTFAIATVGVLMGYYLAWLVVKYASELRKVH